MRKKIILISFLLSACITNNRNEPIVVEISKSVSNNKHGRYFVVIDVGLERASFWSDYEYKIGDTLKVCK